MRLDHCGGYPKMLRDVENRMKRIVHGVFVATVFMACPGCSTFIGDPLLDSADRSTADRLKLMRDARQHATDLLRQVDIPESTKDAILRSVYAALLPTKNQNPGTFHENLVLIRESDTQIEKALDSFIISRGSLRIRSSNRNFIVSGGEVAIEKEGEAGMSIIFAKGAVKISRAKETKIYTLDRTEILYSEGVEVLNPNEKEVR